MRRDLSGSPADAAATRVVRASRSGVLSDVPVLLALDEVPPADEGIAARLARAMQRLSVAGSLVIFSLDPEAKQILDELPECVVLTAADLVMKGTHASDEAQGALLRLTRGLPGLVRSVSGQLVGGLSPQLGSAYYEELGSLARLSVRSSLSDEERRVRLAMLLLGKGSVFEVERATGGGATEIVSPLADEAPLFGVSGHGDVFECLTCATRSALGPCLGRIEAVCALFPDVAEACLTMLVERGELSRAALVGRVAERIENPAAVVARGAEFIDAGEIDFVRRAIDGLCEDDWRPDILLLAIRALTARDPGGLLGTTLEQLQESAEQQRQPQEYIAAQLVDVRRLLRGLPALSLPQPRPAGELERRLWAHRAACDLLVQGRCSEAMRLLISTPRDREHDGLSFELLELDLAIARLVSGDASEPGPDRLDVELPILMSGSLPGASGYLTIVHLLRSSLQGGEGAAEAEALAARAERSGDTLVQAVALLAACIADLRGRGIARARVRALLAATLCSKLGLSYLEREARILSRIADYLMGERGIAPSAVPSDDLGYVERLVDETIQLEDAPAATSAIPDEVPWDALWMLRVVSQGMGDFSELLRRRAPSAWRRALATLERTSASAREHVAAQRALAGDVRPDVAERKSAPIELSLLGGFDMYVRGVRVPDWKLERRNARSMLEYMALERSSSLKRFRLVDQVWPECDYVTGFNRAYQATSALRKMIAEIDPTLDPFVASRTSKEITLDMGLVSCDVDEFKVIAREASDAESDEVALKLARRAEKLYEGDLYLPPKDATGFIAALRAELRALYADAMVAGAGAALRLGHCRTAARMAHGALIADDLREDAMIVLIKALRESGRSREAAKRYAAFASRLADRTSGGVSQELAEAAAGLGDV